MIFCTETCMKMVSSIVHLYISKHSRWILYLFESCYQLTNAVISTYSSKFWDIISIKETIADLNQTRYFLQTTLDNYVVILHKYFACTLLLSYYTHTNICNILGKLVITMILNSSQLQKYNFKKSVMRRYNAIYKPFIVFLLV